MVLDLSIELELGVFLDLNFGVSLGRILGGHLEGLTNDKKN
jgi:hypothetical protein